MELFTSFFNIYVHRDTFYSTVTVREVIINMKIPCNSLEIVHV